MTAADKRAVFARRSLTVRRPPFRSLRSARRLGVCWRRLSQHWCEQRVCPRAPADFARATQRLDCARPSLAVRVIVCYCCCCCCFAARLIVAVCGAGINNVGAKTSRALLAHRASSSVGAHRSFQRSRTTTLLVAAWPTSVRVALVRCIVGCVVVADTHAPLQSTARTAASLPASTTTVGARAHVHVQRSLAPDSLQ